MARALGKVIDDRLGKTTNAGMVIHSEQGVQFGSWAFTDRVKASGLVLSMGSVGDCYDSSMIESLLSRMQVELLDRKKWKTRASSSPMRCSTPRDLAHPAPPSQPTRLAQTDRV